MDLLPPVDVIDFEGSGEAGLLKSSALHRPVKAHFQNLDAITPRRN